MERKKRCPLFRAPEFLSVGKGVGYCDLDNGWAICDGDVQFCEKVDALRTFLRKRLEAISLSSNAGGLFSGQRPSVAK